MTPRPKILSAELFGGHQIRLYTPNGPICEDFSPWLLVEAPEDCNRAGLSGVTGWTRTTWCIGPMAAKPA